ncbi:PepSY domain-containing protein [Cytophagaceae bacterium YF14B1]|uniref:PepSY domain-containing protein n=1 Tax=Xanthocytophaga flava TaxID=3048013 RepID=A0AAE3UDV6_9BACT|nr:PepSY domain-containing protein [Xanthocytophaga flavus]MDJ1486154.1 PepSY domain-containing protein [Xanthocytophaga flavus]
MTFRKTIRIVHLWLGLLTGAVVLVSMIAAAIFVWDKELTDWYYHDYVFVTPQATPPLPLSQLVEAARQTVPGKQLRWIDIDRDPAQAYVFVSYKENSSPTGWTNWDDYMYWDQIYIDPYTGKRLVVVDML